MIGLKYVGYKESTIQRREMSVGQLRHRMALAYMKKENAQFIIMCLDEGERVVINSMKEALELEWSDECMIEIINMPHRWGCLEDNGEMEDGAPTIILIQYAASENDNEKTLL